MNLNKSELRTQLRSICQAISPAAQADAAQNLCINGRELDYLQTSQNIAFYWPSDHEIDCRPLLSSALQTGKNCYLPVLWLKNRQALAFASYDSNTPMLKNRYGILEPDTTYSQLIEVNELDLIFVPLLGFDLAGTRLGRGGGFYDATFAALRIGQVKKLPKIVGLAYEQQKIDKIPLDSWDWPLDAVLTEKTVYRFK